MFDNYVECIVNDIKYKNIRINNKKITDLSKEIKEIKFDKLYQTDNSFGFGKVKEVIKL